MRKFLWLLIGFVSVALAVWLLPRWESSSEQVFLLPEAELTLASVHGVLAAETTRESIPYGFLLEGHHVSSGNGMVLAYRRHTGRPFAIFQSETEKFQYLTVSLPGDFGDKTAVFDLATQGNGHAFLSAANFGFSGRHGCFGFARKGTITVNHGFSGDAKVKIELDIQTISLSTVIPASCGPVEFTGEYQVEVLNPSEFEQALTAPHRGEALSE